MLALKIFKNFRYISWTALIIWMLVIFILSAQVADDSAHLSAGITQIVTEFIQKLFPKTNIKIEDMHHLGIHQTKPTYQTQ